mmetsp:Transcript_82184/g.255192  ORF Transcript_82184/g.255192 Transcript_82184/m.255192 type:complete len:238 (+) Transcript_82184:73-786(+)
MARRSSAASRPGWGRLVLALQVGMGMATSMQDQETQMAVALDEAGASCALSAMQHHASALTTEQRGTAGTKAGASLDGTIPSVVTCAFAQEYSDLCGPSGFGRSVVERGPAQLECTWCYEECCAASVRLTPDGSCLSCATESEGVLEVYHDERWGTVCKDGFDVADASVACRELGYGGGEVVRGAGAPPTAYRAQKPIWLDAVECTGRESTLEECPSAGWGVSNCSHDMDVFVRCYA